MRSEIHFVVESARRQCGRRYVAGALVACALSGGVAARAQVSPNGGEFLVNTYTTNFQGHPAVAVDGQGNFVIAWNSDGS
ncbi:MAG: hypothetical protein ABI689_00840, partial [Thermoanaerobaculia bacterium]